MRRNGAVVFGMVRPLMRVPSANLDVFPRFCFVPDDESGGSESVEARVEITVIVWQNLQAQFRRTIRHSARLIGDGPQSDERQAVERVERGDFVVEKELRFYRSDSTHGLYEKRHSAVSPSAPA